MKTVLLFLGLLWRTVAVFLVVAIAFQFVVKLFPPQLTDTAGFIKLKPTIRLIVIAAVCLIAEFGAGVNVIRLIVGRRLSLAAASWRQYVVGLSLLQIGLGLLNLAVAGTATTEAWINYVGSWALALQVLGIFLLTHGLRRRVAAGT